MVKDRLKFFAETYSAHKKAFSFVAIGSLVGAGVAAAAPSHPHRAVAAIVIFFMLMVLFLSSKSRLFRETPIVYHASAAAASGNYRKLNCQPMLKTHWTFPIFH